MSANICIPTTMKWVARVGIWGKWSQWKSFQEFFLGGAPAGGIPIDLQFDTAFLEFLGVSRRNVRGITIPPSVAKLWAKKQ